MRVSNTFAESVANISLRKEIYINTKGKYMEVSNTLADNAENISLRREIWLNTKGEYTKEYKMLLYKIKPINIKIRFVSKYAKIQVWDILVI